MGKLTRRQFFLDSFCLIGASLCPYSIQQRKKFPSYIGLAESSELGQRIQKLLQVYDSCTLCPRDCRVNRNKGETGNCQGTEKVKVSSAFPHFGEEPPLVGSRGSGTIFFSNCGLRCVYCQNYEISLEGQGVEISDERLAEMMLKVQKFGCHNINLVTPTHYLPNIVNALGMAVKKGLNIPIVYNTGGYEKEEILSLLDGIVDIYLPDCKYMDPKNAAQYSDGAFNYPYYVKLALQEMNRQVGVMQTDGRGVAQRGLMIRHLVLPNRVAGSKAFLEFVSKKLPKNTYINIMRQYRPEYKAKDYPEISRQLKRNEYSEVLRWAKEFGLKRLAQG